MISRVNSNHYCRLFARLTHRSRRPQPQLLSFCYCTMCYSGRRSRQHQRMLSDRKESRSRSPLLASARLAGLLSLSPSDLVCRTTPLLYYDALLCCRSQPHPDQPGKLVHRIFLALLDSNTCVTGLERLDLDDRTAEKLLSGEDEDGGACDYAMALLGVLLWKEQLRPVHRLAILFDDQRFEPASNLHALNKLVRDMQLEYQIMIIRATSERPPGKYSSMERRLLPCVSSPPIDTVPPKLISKVRKMIAKQNSQRCCCLPPCQKH